MKRYLGVLSGLALLALGALYANSANLPLFSGPSCSEPSQLQSCLNQLIAQLNGGTYTQSLAEFNNPRNVVDNGAFDVQQRGTGARTCATTSTPTSAAYAADRWFCDVNVTSGAGQLTVITTTPSPPPGFAQSMKLVRNSGALLQPQCVWQVLPTARAVSLQGQQVVFSIYEQALAGLATDQGSTAQSFNMVVIAGTSADESPTTWTASPAITPAWTGLTTLVNTNFPTPTAPAWARYQTTAAVPINAKELAVGICFTPIGATSGATDGIAFVGAQLEQGSIASPFEFRAASLVLAEAQRFFLRYNEINTVAAVQFGGGTALGTTTTCSIAIPFPVTMYKAPTYTNALSATTFTVTSASQAATVLATPFSATLGANGVNNASINFTTTGMTAKDGCEITSTAAGGGVLDFVSDL
jgi:hypothetical protein